MKLIKWEKKAGIDYLLTVEEEYKPNFLMRLLGHKSQIYINQYVGNVKWRTYPDFEELGLYDSRVDWLENEIDKIQYQEENNETI